MDEVDVTLSGREFHSSIALGKNESWNWEV